jgi:hypothetical protein
MSIGLSGGAIVPRRCDPRAVEDCPRLAASMLSYAGALTPGAVVQLQWPHLTATVRAEPGRVLLTVGGQEAIPIGVVSLPSGSGERYAFECPDCRRPVFVLHEKDRRFSCRGCHRIDHRSRHNWTAPASRLAADLRRKLRADPSLLAPLPRPLKGHRSRIYLAAVTAEARAVENLRQFNRALRRLMREQGS